MGDNINQLNNDEKLGIIDRHLKMWEERGLTPMITRIAIGSKAYREATVANSTLQKILEENEHIEHMAPATFNDLIRKLIGNRLCLNENTFMPYVLGDLSLELQADDKDAKQFARGIAREAIKREYGIEEERDLTPTINIISNRSNNGAGLSINFSDGVSTKLSNDQNGFINNIKDKDLLQKIQNDIEEDNKLGGKGSV